MQAFRLAVNRHASLEPLALSTAGHGEWSTVGRRVASEWWPVAGESAGRQMAVLRSARFSRPRRSADRGSPGDALTVGSGERAKRTTHVSRVPEIGWPLPLIPCMIRFSTLKASRRKRRRVLGPLGGRSALRAGLWPRAAPPGAGRGSMSATPGVRSEDVAPFMPLADRSAAGGSLRSRREGFFSSRSPYTRCITQLGRSRPVG